MLIYEYITFLAAFALVTVAVYVPVAVVLRKRGIGLIRQSSYMLLFLSFALVIFVTIILFNMPISFEQEWHILNLQPLEWLVSGEEDIKRRFVTEIGPNIMMFIPLGFFTPAVFARMRKCVLTAVAVFCVTFGIEFFQYFIGRSSDVDDVIANVTGGIIGYCCFKISGHLCKDQTWWRTFTKT
jgi:glycopeptide antibiotics resistance protein